MKEYRKVKVKLSWLAQGTHPDLNYIMLVINDSVTLADLGKVNKVLKKVKSRESEVYYRRVGDRDELQLIGIEDAYFKQDEKVVNSVILLLADKDLERVSPLY